MALDFKVILQRFATFARATSHLNLDLACSGRGDPGGWFEKVTGSGTARFSYVVPGYGIPVEVKFCEREDCTKLYLKWPAGVDVPGFEQFGPDPPLGPPARHWAKTLPGTKVGPALAALAGVPCPPKSLKTAGES